MFVLESNGIFTVYDKNKILQICLTSKVIYCE